MKNKFLFFAVLIMLAASVFAGCSRGSDNAPPQEGVSVGDIITSSSPNRKIVYTVATQIETSNFKQAVDKVKAELDAAEGYIEASDISTNGGKQYAEYVLRVKTDNLSQFLGKIAEGNKVLYQTIQSEDITKQYFNVKSEKDAYERELELLEEMLGKEGLTETQRLAYLDKLTETNAKLNALANQIAVYEELVEFSTVRLYLYETGSQVPQINSYGEKIGNTFIDSLNVLLKILEFVSRAIVALFPFAAIIFAVFIGIRYLIKFLEKRWPEKFDKKKNRPARTYDRYYQDFLRQKYAQEQAAAQAGATPPEAQTAQTPQQEAQETQPEQKIAKPDGKERK
jgi:hypothetical protein